LKKSILAESNKGENNNGSRIIKGNSSSKPITPRLQMQPVPTAPKGLKK